MKKRPFSRQRRRRSLSGTGDEELKRAKATLYKGVFYAGTALAVATGALVIFKKVKGTVQAAARDRAENNSFKEADPGLYAKQLKLAFNPSGYDWMQAGDTTDEALVFSTLQEIPSRKAYQAVVTAYGRLYPGRNLNADLLEELDASEFAKAKQIINSKK